MDNIIIGILSFIMIGVSSVLGIIELIAIWMIFNKAGEAGWKSLIPILNLHTLYKICWNPVMGWVFIALYILTCIVLRLDRNNMLILVAAIILILSLLIITIIQIVKLSKVFGHGMGFALGLFFFSPIFVIILGFGNSKYIGKGKKSIDTL